MSVPVRVLATLAYCLVAVQWRQAVARAVGPVTASSSLPPSSESEFDDVIPDDVSPVMDRLPARRLPVGTYAFDKDEADETDVLPGRQIVSRSQQPRRTRSAWAPSEMRLDELLYRLRSQVRQNRFKHSSPALSPNVARWRRSEPISSDIDLERLQKLIMDDESAENAPNDVVGRLEAEIALLRLLKASSEGPEADELVETTEATQHHHEDEVAAAAAESAVDVEDDPLSDEEGLADDRYAVKRAMFAGAGVDQIRNPRDIHPVYLGIGQNAASAALRTYASLLADDKRRENFDHRTSSNPVRFIGKR